MVTRRRASTSLPAPLLQDDYDGGRVGLPAFWGSGHLRNKKNASGQAEAGRCGVCSEQGMLGGRGDRGGLPSLGLQLPPRSVRRLPSILSPTWRRDGMQGCCRGTGLSAPRAFPPLCSPVQGSFLRARLQKQGTIFSGIIYPVYS